MVFAHCPRLYSGVCQSEEERRQEIKKHLNKISWIRSDAPLATPAAPHEAAALIILQVPSPAQPFQKRAPATQRSPLLFWRNLFLGRRKLAAESFDNSMVCYGQPYTWAIYKTLKKRQLIRSEFLEELRAAERNGFDVQLVLTKRHKLHRPGDAPNILHIITLSLDEFCDKFSSVIDSSIAPL